jgi:hypothetical protein
MVIVAIPVASHNCRTTAKFPVGGEIYFLREWE